MSRTIKAYPYNEEFGDTICCSAESIKEFEFPQAVSCISKDFQEHKLLVSFEAEAKEDEKGIFIKAYTKPKAGYDIPKELLGLSTTIIVDEIKFVDAVYDAVTVEQSTMDESKIIQDMLYSAVKKFTEEFVFPAGYYLKNSHEEWVNTF